VSEIRDTLFCFGGLALGESGWYSSFMVHISFQGTLILSISRHFCSVKIESHLRGINESPIYKHTLREALLETDRYGNSTQIP
jgi:hypothetical protein